MSQIETTEHYGGTLKLEYNDSKHHYIVDGETYTGCTSALGVIAKPALTFWAAKMASEYVDKNLPLNTPIDEIAKKRLTEGAKAAHRNFLKDAADIGTLFHSWAEAYIKGSQPVMPTNPMFKKAVENFLKWVGDNNVKFIASEQKVVSKKYKFCGTFDFLATVDGKIVLGDLKTSSGIYNEQYLQVSAYKGAYLEEFPDKVVDHTLIVRCGKKGDFEVKEMNNFEKNYKAFLAALTLHKHMKDTKNFKCIN